MFRGSMRTFSALVQSMVKKGKIGYGVLRARKGDTPALVAMLPQVEHRLIFLVNRGGYLNVIFLTARVLQ